MSFCDQISSHFVLKKAGSVCIRWKISNIHLIRLLQINEFLESIPFKINDSAYKLKLRLSDESGFHVNFMLDEQTSTSSDSSRIDEKDINIYLTTNGHQINGVYTYNGFFIKHSKENLIYNEATIYCVVASDDIIVQQNDFTGCPQEQQKNEVSKILMNEFWTQYKNEQNTDVTFRFPEDDNRIIRAHIVILKLHSEVFRAMFETDMLEKNLSTVDITHINYDVFKCLVNYSYTGEYNFYENSDESVMDLYIAADYYDIGKLREFCEISILNRLDDENVCKTLTFATNYNLPNVIKVATNYFQNNKDLIVLKDYFNSWAKDNPDLAISLLE